MPQGEWLQKARVGPIKATCLVIGPEVVVVGSRALNFYIWLPGHAELMSRSFVCILCSKSSATPRNLPSAGVVAPLATSRQESITQGRAAGGPQEAPLTLDFSWCSLSGCLWAWSWGLVGSLKATMSPGFAPYFPALSWTLFLSEWSLLVLSSSQAGAAMLLRLLLGAMAQQLLRVAPREGLLSLCPEALGDMETVVTARPRPGPRTGQASAWAAHAEPPAKGSWPLGTWI